MHSLPKIYLKYPTILASSSPQRQALLSGLLGTKFQIIAPNIDEDSFTAEVPSQLPSILAKEKAFKVYEKHPNSLVIAADTIVVSNGKIYGKPNDFDDALQTLQSLSGKVHQVITGVALRWPKGLINFTESTEVEFRPFTEKEIQSYLLTNEWKNKCGSYTIQSKAKQWVRCVKGELNNVMGLPTKALAEALKEIY